MRSIYVAHRSLHIWAVAQIVAALAISVFALIGHLGLDILNDSQLRTSFHWAYPLVGGIRGRGGHGDTGTRGHGDLS